MATGSPKLDFSNLVSLPGRSEQLEILHHALRNASSSFVGNTVNEESARQQKKKLSSSPDGAAAASTLSTTNGTTAFVPAAVATRAAVPKPPPEEAPRDITERPGQTSTGCTIVTVTGASGTGKTALIGEFKKQVQDKCYFCQGYFHKQRLPSTKHRKSAAGDCLFDLIHQIMMYRDVPMLLHAINEGVSESERHILITAFPGLTRLFLIGNDRIGKREAEGDVDEDEIMLSGSVGTVRRGNCHKDGSSRSINSVVQILPLATGRCRVTSNGTTDAIVGPTSFPATLTDTSGDATKSTRGVRKAAATGRSGGAAAIPAAAAAASTASIPAGLMPMPIRLPSDSRGAELSPFALDRLRLAVRSLLRVIVTTDLSGASAAAAAAAAPRPVVWVTEDMQWGDMDTLKLIWTLLEDEKLNNFLWIGTYRTNDECTAKDEPHDTRKEDCTENVTFQNRMKLLFHLSEEEDMEGSSDRNAAMMILPSTLDVRRFYDIHVTNLSSDSISEILQALLQRYDDDEGSAEELSALAKAIHHKTAGNAFFVQEYLLTLNRLGLLYYSLSTFRWEWQDVNRIYDETTVSDNVVDVVISKIQTLPSPLQVALTVAAFLDSTHFDLETLFRTIQAVQDAQSSWAGLTKQLKTVNQPVDSGTDLCNNKASTLASDDPLKGIGGGRDTGTLITSMVQLEEHLEAAIADNLLEKFRPSASMSCTFGCSLSVTYKFSHDRIHDAAYSLLPEGRARQSLHYSIGRQLLRKLSELDDDKRGTPIEDRLVLLAAHQLDLGSPLIDESSSRVELAKLNLRAAELSIKRTALVPSLQYLKDAIRLLKEDGLSSAATATTRRPWEQHYDLMLDLSLKLSETYLSCGNFVESKNVAEDILNHARSSQDRWGAKYTIISCLAHEGNFESAYRIIFQVFKELRVYFPTMFLPVHIRAFLRVHIRIGMLRAQLRLRHQTDDDLMQLAKSAELVNDAQVRTAYLFMSQLIHISTLARDSDIRLLGALRILKWTLNYGPHKSTGHAFATYAQCLQSMGVWDKAFRFGQLAVKIAQQRKAGYRDAVCLLVHHFYVNHWQKPYHESLEPVLTAYHICMQSPHVDFSYVFFAIRAYSQLYLCCGLRLDPLEADMRRFSDMMREFGQSAYAAMYSPWWQLVLNFMGRAKDPEVLTGEVMDQDGLIEEWTQKKNAAVLASISFCRGVLAFYFSDLELAEQIFSGLPSDTQASSALLPQLHLYDAIIASSLSRSTGKVKYKRKLRLGIRHFEKWVRNGCVNCPHMLLLLKAEQCRLDHPDKAQEAYDAAISAAAKLGFLHHHALANELAGIHFLDVGDTAWASTYLQRARDLYADWGADAKVLHMEGKYGSSFFGAGPVLRKEHMGVKARVRLNLVSRASEGNPYSLMTTSLIRLAKRRMSK